MKNISKALSTIATILQISSLTLLAIACDANAAAAVATARGQNAAYGYSTGHASVGAAEKAAMASCSAKAKTECSIAQSGESLPKWAVYRDTAGLIKVGQGITDIQAKAVAKKAMPAGVNGKAPDLLESFGDNEAISKRDGMKWTEVFKNQGRTIELAYAK